MQRLQYYFNSILTVFRQVYNWPSIILIFFKQRPILKLRTGLKFRVRSLMDVWVVKETCLDRDYELNSIAIKDGWQVVDIGAGIGDFSILTGHDNPRGRVYAFEPFPESYALLQENLSLNAVGNVATYDKAVGASTGVMLLKTTGESVQHTTTQSTVSGQAASVIEVQALSLDDIFRINGILQCDYLKMDCEGGEYEILFHASPNTLNIIRHICLEYHDGFTDYDHSDLVGHLQKFGFKVTTRRNPVHEYLGFLYAYRETGE